MKRVPEAPVDVRVEMRDGRVIPVECVYVGFHDGVDTWEVAYPLGGQPSGIAIEVLPAETAVVLNGEWRRTAHP